jgi:hypothetical protein
MTVNESDMAAVTGMVDRMRRHLAGHRPELQGAALADLLATWLAGHHIEGDARATNRLRTTILSMHVETVREMVPIAAKEIGTTP